MSSSAHTIRDALSDALDRRNHKLDGPRLQRALAALAELEAELAHALNRESQRMRDCELMRQSAEAAQAELERLTVGRATLEDQTNRAELAEARVDALEAALREYRAVLSESRPFSGGSE